VRRNDKPRHPANQSSKSGHRASDAARLTNHVPPPWRLAPPLDRGRTVSDRYFSLRSLMGWSGWEPTFYPSRPANV
jgi:hypothetical protein